MYIACAVILTLLVCVCFGLALGKRLQMPNSVLFAAIAWVLGAVCAYVCSKLVFIVLYGAALIPTRGLGSVLALKASDMSFAGGAIGGCVGVWLASLLGGQPARRVLNVFAPFGALQVAVLRGCEWFLGEQGAGDWLPNGSIFAFPPIAMHNEWDEWLLAVCSLEALLALAVMVYAFIRQKDLAVFLKSCALLCGGQMFFEMLRNRVLIYSFVRVDQVICALVLLAFTVYACVKRKKGTPKRFLPLVGLFIAAGINALMQFVQDKPLTFTGMLPDSAADALMPWIPTICTVCFALTAIWMTVITLRAIHRMQAG